MWKGYAFLHAMKTRALLTAQHNAIIPLRTSLNIGKPPSSMSPGQIQCGVSLCEGRLPIKPLKL